MPPTFPEFFGHTELRSQTLNDLIDWLRRQHNFISSEYVVAHMTDAGTHLRIGPELEALSQAAKSSDKLSEIWIWAQITEVANEDGAYEWREMAAIKFGRFEKKQNGRTGGPGKQPAFEEDGSRLVPKNAIVQLRPKPNMKNPNLWVFSHCCPGQFGDGIFVST